MQIRASVSPRGLCVTQGPLCHLGASVSLTQRPLPHPGLSFVWPLPVLQRRGSILINTMVNNHLWFR